MAFLKIKTLANPLPEPPSNANWTILGVVWGLCGTIVTVLFKYIDGHFAARKQEKEDFIKAVVKEAMSEQLRDINDKVSKLFEYRESDRENVDRKFEKVMSELKK